MFVYKITNQVNGKVYIGITTTSVAKRWREHKCAAKKGNLRPLYKSIRKYGHENFLVEQLATASSVEELKEKEVLYIKELNAMHTSGSGYNMTDGGNGVHFVNRARGEQSGGSVLTEDVVRFIRSPDLRSTANVDMVDLVKTKFGKVFEIDTIKLARNGTNWKYLNDTHPPIKAEKGSRKKPMSDARRAQSIYTLNRFRPEAVKKAAEMLRGKRAAHAKMDYDTVKGIFYEPMSLLKTADKYGISKKMVLLVRQQRVYTYWTKEFQNAVNI